MSLLIIEPDLTDRTRKVGCLLSSWRILLESNTNIWPDEKIFYSKDESYFCFILTRREIWVWFVFFEYFSFNLIQFIARSAPFNLSSRDLLQWPLIAPERSAFSTHNHLQILLASSSSRQHSQYFLSHFSNGNSEPCQHATWRNLPPASVLGPSEWAERKSSSFSVEIEKTLELGPRSTKWFTTSWRQGLGEVLYSPC